MGRSDATGRKEWSMKRFEVGARVVEPTYGLGSVVAVEDAYTRVQFDEHGVKKFLTSMSKLEPSSEPLPAGLRAAGKPRKKRATKKAVEEPVAAED
jgi:RNA polymerase-interacting CarD/CdnL/TRCF family regulator